jgi:hypothetical protein
MNTFEKLSKLQSLIPSSDTSTVLAKKEEIPLARDDQGFSSRRFEPIASVEVIDGLPIANSYIDITSPEPVDNIAAKGTRYQDFYDDYSPEEEEDEDDDHIDEDTDDDDDSDDEAELDRQLEAKEKQIYLLEKQLSFMQSVELEKHHNRVQTITNQANLNIQEIIEYLQRKDDTPPPSLSLNELVVEEEREEAAREEGDEPTPEDAHVSDEYLHSLLSHLLSTKNESFRPFMRALLHRLTKAPNSIVSNPEVQVSILSAIISNL